MLSSFAQVSGVEINGKAYQNLDTIKICSGSTINYVSTASDYSTIYWTFNPAIPASSTETNPIVTYKNAGVSVTKQYVSNGVATDSLEIFIIISDRDANLSASFDYSPKTTECASQNYLFTNQSAGNNLTYYWDFGDISYNNSTAKNPVHRYSSAIGNGGTQKFTVTLIAADENNCLSSFSRELSVKRIPDAQLGTPDNTVTKTIFDGFTTFSSCNKNYNKKSVYKFKFKNTSATLASNQRYTIKWGDKVSPDSSFTIWNSDQVIEHPYPFGNSVMTLQIKGPESNECIAEETYNVFVGYIGDIQTSSSSIDICEGQQINTTLSGFENNPPGTIYGYAVNGLISNTVIYPNSNSSLTLKFDKTSCGQTGNTWKIDFFAINPCGITKRTQQVAVSQKTKAAMQFSTENAFVCTGSNFNVSNISDYGNIVKNTGSGYECINALKPQQAWIISPSKGYTLTGNTGNMSGSLISTNGSQQLGINFSDTGTYTIKLYITDEKCGYDSIIKTICVQGKPAPAFQILSNKNSHCISDTLALQNNTANGKCAVNQYLWTVKQSDAENCGAGLLPVYLKGSDTSMHPELWLKEPGHYNITLKASINNSCADSSTQTWLVKGLPKIAINITDTFCIDNSINPLADTSSCYATQALKYSWSLPGANPDTSMAFLPSNIIYHQPGKFPVILHAENECGLAGDTAFVTVLDKPLANAGNDTAICSNDSVTIGVNTGDYTYSWYPATGLSDVNAAQPVVHFKYAVDTTITYYLNVLGRTKCEATDSVKVTIKKSPVTVISTGNTGVCADSSIVLTANGAAFYNWSPSLYLNRIDSNTVVSTPLDSVTYTVTGTAANGCQSNAPPVTLNIFPSVKAAFTPLDAYTNCSSYNLANIIHTDTANEANGNYLWYINGRLNSSNATGAAPGYMVTAKDTVKLVVQSKYGCKPDSVTQVFSVLPHVKALFTKDNYSGCEPLTVSFSNNSSGGNNINYDWDFGNGAVSNLQQPGAMIFKTAESGRDTIYYITLKVTDSCGTDILRDSVLVKAMPKATFDIRDAKPGCSPDTITFINTSQGNYNMFNWNLGDGTSFNTVNNLPFTNIYTSTNPKTFSVVLTATNSCGTDTANLDLTIAANDIYVFVQPNGTNIVGCNPDTVSFTNATTGATFAEWVYGDGTVENLPANQQNITHVFKDTGTFNITATFSNTCNIAKITQLVQVLERPKANFEIINGNRFANDIVVCDLDSVKINILQQTGNRNTITWGDETGIISPPNSGYLYNRTGYYSIQLLAEKLNSEGVTVCGAQDIKRIKIGTRPNAGIMPLSNSIDCYHEQIQLNAYGGVLYSWYPDENIAGTNSGRPHVFPKITTTYYVDITGASGCKVSDSINVKVAYAELQSNQFIAKAFSPNGDGINDLLQVHLPALTKMIDFKVFNRWGKIVFQTKNAGSGWDGKFNGALQPQEVYNYVLSIVSDCIPGGAQNIKGDIMLLR